MRTFICLLLIAVAPAWAEPVRVMSFNIRYGTANDGDNHWKHRREFVAETIREFNPDVLGTQEMLDFQRAFVEKKLPGYGFHGVGRDDGKKKGEFAGIFYRSDRLEKVGGGHYWLSEQPGRPGSVSWDSSMTRMASWLKLRDKKSGVVFFFFNTHFDHRGAKARHESAKLIAKQVKALAGDGRVIVCGDFNCGEGSAPYRALVPPLRDTYRITYPERKDGEGTFCAWNNRRNGARIDWVLCSAGWKVVEGGILRPVKDGRSPSDHFPVIAVLEP